MNIRDEYKKLKALSETPKGWQEIEDSWSELLGMEKIDANWISAQHSKGPKVEGFAIDSKTGLILHGTIYDHSWAYNELCDQVLSDEDVTVDEVVSRIKKGWCGKILDFELPCILMTEVVSASVFSEDVDGEDELKVLSKLEKIILEKEAGLPLNMIFLNQVLKDVHRNERKNRKS